MNNSIWNLDTTNNIKELKKDLDIDILIIGGGITGISICYNLINCNKKVVLVEANKVGTGITSKTLGKITALQGHYQDIYNKYGYYITKKYYTSQLEAINLLTKTIIDNKIDCNLEKADAYLYSSDEATTKKLQEEFQILQKIGFASITKEKTLPNKEEYPYIIRDTNSYTFHPLKYINSLKQIISKNKIDIYENTRIISIIKKDNYYICKSNNGIIKTNKIILACHYPFFLFPYMMPLKVTLEKSYIAAKKEKYYNFSALNKNDKESFRFYKNLTTTYKILQYGTHNISFNNNYKKHFENLKNKINNWNYLWTNMDIMTGDYIPLIGKIKENLYLATGYNTWGMTNGTLAGKVISDLLLKNENTYEKLLDPNRKIYSHWLLAIGSSMYSFTKEKFLPQKKWYNKKIVFDKINNQDVAIYYDNYGIKHPVLRKCPHLKCQLLFNEEEKTWDCPCHGSRFDLEGNVIAGPSNYDIKVK